jgi:hypothetical protein
MTGESYAFVLLRDDESVVHYVLVIAKHYTMSLGPIFDSNAGGTELSSREKLWWKRHQW